MKGRLGVMAIVITVTVVTLGCSIGEMIVGVPTPTPTVTKTPMPTFTPMPPPTATPLPTNTPLPTPTARSMPHVGPTATATPGPSGTTTADDLNFRTGPGTSYTSLGKLARGTTVEVRARVLDSSWLKVCCYQGQEGWVYAQYLRLSVPITTIPVDSTVAVAPTRPASTPAPPTVTVTPTTPVYRFALLNKEGFPTTNPFLDIGVRIFNGQADNFLAGYRVKVLDTTNGKEYLSKVSTDTFHWTDMPDSGAAKKANVNFDPIPNPGTIDWVIYVTDEAGNRLSADVAFTTTSAKPEKYYFVFSGK